MAAAYTLLKNGYIRFNAENAQFPANSDNRYWLEYQTWQAAGGVPDPIEADPPPSQTQLDIIAAKADTEVQALAAMTPAQAAALVQAITNLAEAKLVLRRMAVILCILAKRL